MTSARILKLPSVPLFAAVIALSLNAPRLRAQATRVVPVYQQNQSAQPGQQPAQPGVAYPGQFPNGQPPNPSSLGQIPSPNAPRGGDLIVGPGDVLQVQIADEPDLNGKYLISDMGEVTIPSVSEPIRATGLTTTELANSIAAALKKAEILRDPVVSVFVEEYHSHTVTVVGAVVRPGLYPVETHTTVLDVISEAGGLLPSAGNLITIAKGGSAAAMSLEAAAAKPAAPGQIPTPSANSRVQNASVPAGPPAGPDVVNLDFYKLISGKDPSLNISVTAGDVVSVGTAPIVYIVGAVTKPGAFAIQNEKSEITVLQALALVEGMTSVASAGHAVIVRNSGDPDGRQEVPIDINKLEKGKTPDLYLSANDILFIPESGRKKSMQKLGNAAVQAASEVAGYGMALRIGAY